jgi:hypothetical protein
VILITSLPQTEVKSKNQHWMIKPSLCPPYCPHDPRVMILDSIKLIQPQIKTLTFNWTINLNTESKRPNNKEVTLIPNKVRIQTSKNVKLCNVQLFQNRKIHF